MLAAVQFDDHGRFEADEIKDVRAEGALPAESESAELTAPEVVVNQAAKSELSTDARAYYECAAYLFKHGLYAMPGVHRDEAEAK